MNRPAKLTLIIGTNYTGKTTLERHLIKSMINAKQRVLVVVPDDIEFPELEYANLELPQKYTSEARKVVFEIKHTLPLIRKNFNGPGAVFFEDCRSFTRAQLDDELHGLIIRRRQKMIDIFAVGHGFTEIPPKFFTFATDIILFRTTDNIISRKDVIKDFDRMAEAQARVNKKAINDPHYFEIIKY